MPYSTITDLPPQVRDSLTTDEQRQWLAVFNAVFAQTLDEEKAILAAWGAVRKGRTVGGRSVALVKADGLVIVRGWGVLFTDPAHTDSYGTHFSLLSHLLAEYYQDAPLWYEHGLDADYDVWPIGKRHAVEIYGFGVWAEHSLFPDHRLFERTVREIEEGQLAYSSDSIAHYVEQGINQANGELRMWPLAGWSLTRQPAEEGLGPVTLAGMEATIREVTQAPARRVPLAGGRAVLTLTACKSVYDPPRDPTVPAEVRPTQAREARGAGGSYRSTLSLRGVPMDPETLAALADFLGVDATPEAVLVALRDLITSLEGAGGEGETAAESAIDGSALRAALQLETDADDEAVIDELEALALALNPAPARSYNYAALGSAVRGLRSANPDMPHFAPGDEGEDDDSDEDDPGARPAARSARRSLYAPNINRGATRPGMGAAILAALGHRPPGFRSGTPLRTIRARLFQMDRAARAASDDGPQGAWVLNREIAADILDPLTSKLVLFEAGAEPFPMDGIDSLTIRKQVGAPGAYWAAEGTSWTAEGSEFAIATLNLKELRAPTRWPNKWLRNLAAGAEQKIRNQMEHNMRLKLEYSALFGDGKVPADGTSTGAQPLGVRYTDGVTVRALSPAATPGLADLQYAVEALEDANVEETEYWGWISHPRTFRTFEYMRDENGAPILRNSWAEGVRTKTLVDYPYHKSTNIPKTLGSGANESVLFCGDWSELAVGIGQDVELLASEHRLIDSNETFVMAVGYFDIAVMYPEAFHVTTGVLR